MSSSEKNHAAAAPSSSSRRRFLKRTALAGAALTAPVLWLPGRSRARPVRSSAPVRIQGRVEAAGRGLEGVGVTDGLSVVETDAEGAFELVSAAHRPFVYLSVPAGYAVPHETGLPRVYQPIRPNGDGQMQARFELARADDAGDAHAFVVMADPQMQTEEEMAQFRADTIPDVQATVAALDAPSVFGVCCGDLTFDQPELYPSYEEALAEVGVPLFQVLGNHDMDYDGATDEASAETFRGRFGPTYYSFDRGAVHYVVLDDVFWGGGHSAGYMGYLTADQLRWLRQDLARVETGRPVVVFAHIPLLSTQFRRVGEGQPARGSSVANREALYTLLDPYEAHVITGHTHENEHVFEGGVHEHVLGTACGAWWSGPICHDGTPSGYGVFEMDSADLQWRYKATGRPDDYQLRVYPRGSDPRAPREIVANVWDWDPEWTVVWYEGSDRRGAMARRVGTDPLSETLHRGEDAPEHRPWVEPKPTGHLFYAPVAPEATDLRVEATDRFGRTYTATPEEAT